MLNRLISTLALVAMLALGGMMFAAGPAAAANGCDNNPANPNCEVGVGDPGIPGTPVSPGNPSTGTPVGFTPGPTVCQFDGQVVPCSSPDGTFSLTANCQGYIKLADPQAAPPAGKTAAVGAWYSCAPYCPPNPLRPCYIFTSWSDVPPAGIVRYTPAQAAAALVKTFQLRGIEIGMAPEDKVHVDDPVGTAAYRRTWVGIPVWLWVDNPQPLDYGPYTETATLGGVTVTATATVSSITWRSGDGQSLSCGGGTRFDLAAMKDQLAQDSPTCGFRYQKTSGEAGFTVTATSHWIVNWTGGGTNGTIVARDTPSTAPVRVGELQSVIVNSLG